MTEREGYKMVTVSIPKKWMKAIDLCRKAFGNTRSAEVREAVRERLVRNGYGPKIGSK